MKDDSKRIPRLRAAASRWAASGATGERAAPRRIPQRAEIDASHKWSVADIYENDARWEADFTATEKSLAEVAAYRGRLGESGPVLLEFLRLRDALEERLDRLVIFACLRRDEDMRVSTYQAMADRATALAMRAAEALSFADPELLALPDGRLDQLLRESSGLALYAHAFDNLLRRKPHTLSEEGEKLLAMAAESGMTPSTVFGMFNNADLKYGVVRDETGEEVELTKARYAVLQNAKDRGVREESWRRMHEAYGRFENTLAANLSGQVKRHLFNAKARRYPSALEAALDVSKIPTQVYRNLVSTVREGIAPLHRYMRLRKRVLGVDALRSWDLAVPFLPELDRKYPWDEAVATVRAGVAQLGDAYVAAYDEGIASGWIDVYESEGKRGGAYSWGSYSTKPYLLMNYNDTLDDLFTLAHEMGHSIHSLFTHKSQPYVYGSYPIFLAEVASTSNEALLVEKLIAEAPDRSERISLLNHYLDQIRGTFFVQTMFADFELTIHEMAERGEALTGAALRTAFRDLYRTYHGDALEIEPLAEVGWARIPHFYYNFYVYQYATSYAAATALAGKIRREGRAAVEPYLGMLKAGGSDYPIAILQRAGVDLTTPAPIRATIHRFSELLAEIETLLGEG